MNHSSIEFLPINLELHATTCIKFRADSFFCSFGNNEIFFTENGRDGAVYLDWLRKSINEDPLSAWHIWEEGRIIGQLELKVRKDSQEKKVGYVHLFYLISEKRGTGISELLNTFVEQHYIKLGIYRLVLAVSVQNVRAISYYVKHGWTQKEKPSDTEGVYYMEKFINRDYFF